MGSEEGGRRDMDIYKGRGGGRGDEEEKSGKWLVERRSALGRHFTSPPSISHVPT